MAAFKMAYWAGAEWATSKAHSQTAIVPEMATDLRCITFSIVDSVLSTSVSNTVSDTLETRLSLWFEFLLTSRGKRLHEQVNIITKCSSNAPSVPPCASAGTLEGQGWRRLELSQLLTRPCTGPKWSTSSKYYNMFINTIRKDWVYNYSITR